MTSRKITIGMVVSAVFVLILVGGTVVSFRVNVPAALRDAPQDRTETQSVVPNRKFKVLHVMSFHTPWEWTESQFNGFKDSLSSLNVEYKIYEMDGKRRSSPEWLEQAGREAMQLIEEWKPDLVFTSDDAAQKYVTVPCLGREIPFVFCGVNANPEDYGYTRADNVAGVLEREHFVESLRLLKQIVPSVRKVAIITDTAPMWKRVIDRMKQSHDDLGEVEIVRYDVIESFEEYQRVVKGYEGKVDAIGFLGIFEFKGNDGKNVPYQTVCRWTAGNSNLPDFSYWVDRVDYGTLCAVTVSGFSQGQEAGKFALEILVNGQAPSSLPMAPTVKGEPVISLARARRLGLIPSSDILLTARVISKFQWE
ncbi:MAG TPA: hypothetical protein DCX07_11405 [Phycisphaerales bacterium]|nr:hypothetical protein [Phycisphaerales bacterium]